MGLFAYWVLIVSVYTSERGVEGIGSRDVDFRGSFLKKSQRPPCLTCGAWDRWLKQIYPTVAMTKDLTEDILV